MTKLEDNIKKEIDKQMRIGSFYSLEKAKTLQRLLDESK